MRTQPFTISRSKFARLSAEFYVRRFWPFLLPWFLLGGFLLFTAATPGMQVLGFFCMAWPMTVPARALLLTGGPAKLYQTPLYVTLEDGFLFFHGEQGKGMKIKLSRISSVKQIGMFVAVGVGYLNAAFISLDAMDGEKDLERLTEQVAQSKTAVA